MGDKAGIGKQVMRSKWCVARDSDVVSALLLVTSKWVLLGKAMRHHCVLHPGLIASVESQVARAICTSSTCTFT